MELNRLTANDRDLFNKFLALNTHELSAYAFENIYIWKGLFDIFFKVIGDSLCIFFRDKAGGLFMNLPPLAKTTERGVAEEAFVIMDSVNKNKEVSRTENVEGKDAIFYKGLGHPCIEKPCEYLYNRTELAQLKGDRFKSKRHGFNYFIERNEFEYQPFSSGHKEGCLLLYDSWIKNRQLKGDDYIYQSMLKDSRACFGVLLNDFEDLGFVGRVVMVNKEIKAFTFGFGLNKETFCIMYEITDLSIKGLSQFIFRQFCGELKGYSYINVMDDSGLENLKRVKLSYRPIRLIPCYTVKRKAG